MKVLQFTGIWFYESDSPAAVFKTDLGTQLYDRNGLEHLIEQQLRKGGSVDPLLHAAWQKIRQYQPAHKRR